VKLPSILKSGNLHLADAALGEGPFEIRYGIHRFLLAGPSVISSIREMYVRDVYLGGGYLRLAGDMTVVDLGANVGAFTNLAVSHSPGIRVIAVEPSRSLNLLFERSVALNGASTRVQLIRAFVGGQGAKQSEVVASDDNYTGAPWISAGELIASCHLLQIDFLKCDIEGSEFELFVPPSTLLTLTRQLAIEIHSFAGDVATLIATIAGAGLSIGSISRAPDGSVTLLAKRID
jgi:FkbM family methyltransferase